MIKKIFAFLCLLALAGCDHTDRALIQALQKAGPNRKELEQVLAHYRSSPSDSLQYKAARFLIENMEDKYYNTGVQYDHFLHFIDSISMTSMDIDNYMAAIDSFYKKNKTLAGKLKRVYDIETIHADFLIHNIDMAFEAYRTAPWYKDIQFDDFCRYILPYRFGSEPLSDLRKKFYDQYRPFVDRGTLTIQMATDSILKRVSEKKMDIKEFHGSIPDFPVSSLLLLKGGSCRESSDLGLYILRALGLPVASDFTPQWPHRGLGHSWCALIINKDSCIDFEGATSQRVGGHLRLSTAHRMAKAYRHTYEKQLNSLALLHGEEEIPDLFKDAYMQDVSTAYFKTVDISFDIPNVFHERFAYLNVFNDQDWVPIHWGQIVDHKVTFTRMGKMAVYLPGVYRNGKTIPAGDPVLVDSEGNVRPMIAQTNVLRTVVLTRKYPVFDWWNTRPKKLKGGRFQASNQADFKNASEVYMIKDIPEMTIQNVAITENRAFKYWRYLSPDSSYGSIAEIEFIDEKDHIVKGKVIGTFTPWTSTRRENAFDGDPLTYYQADSANGNWVGLALDRPCRIKRIRYLCHNDDNFIEKGENYELYYWANNDWRSLGAQVGTDSQALVYRNVPSNALLLLRDHTKGKEERIFTYEQGKQVWW